MTSKSDEKRAKTILGQAAWKELTNAASGGRIKAQQMTDVVWDLPTDQNENMLGGEHDRRMAEKGTKADATEMKNILADWFHYGDMPQDRVGALEVLIIHPKKDNVCGIQFFCPKKSAEKVRTF